MKNLFKKGFASLALASAMTSGVFAGNDAMIDIQNKFGTGGLGKFTLLAGTDGNGTNTTAFINSIKGLEIVVNVVTASKNMIPLSTSDFQADNSIKNLIPFKGDNRDNILRSNFGSMFAIFAIPKVDSMSVALAGVESIFKTNIANNKFSILGVQTGTSELIKFTKISNIFIEKNGKIHEYAGATSIFGLKHNIVTAATANITNMNEHFMKPIKGISAAESGIVNNMNNLFKTHLLSVVDYSYKNTNLKREFVITSNSSLSKYNMKNTSLVPDYVLGNTASISCASLFKPNSGSCSNDIRKNLFTGTFIPMENPGANFANTLVLSAAV